MPFNTPDTQGNPSKSNYMLNQSYWSAYTSEMLEVKEISLPDLKILEDLLGSEKLNEEEESAFTQMHDDLHSGKFQKLTVRQRDWAEGVHRRLGLDPGTENLVSSGRVKVTEEQRSDLKKFLDTLGPKALRPPGR